MARTYDVMAAGHLCLDIIPRIPDTGACRIGEVLHPGKLLNTGPVKICTGGPVSNTGFNMKTLGNNVCFCARIGDDEFGRLTLEWLERNGNADGIHTVHGSASSYTVVLAPPRIDRIFLHSPGTNDEYGLEDLNLDLVSQCRLFHFGYPPAMRRMFEEEGRELERVFRVAKESGATTSCDMALPDPASPSGQAPWVRILERVLPYVDIFLPSIEESLFMLERDAFLKMKSEHGGAELIDFLMPEDYSRIADKLLSFGTKMASLKTGHRGFYLKTGSQDAFDRMGAARPKDTGNWRRRELWAPALAAPNMASAIGAGDSAIAGFLTAFLKGLSIEESLRAAVCLGWQNLQELDSISGIRTWPETLDMASARAPLIDADIQSPGWSWSEEWHLWAGPDDSKR